MNKQKCQQIRMITQTILSAAFRDEGITVTLKSGSYSTGHFTVKIEFAEKSADGKALTTEYEDLLWQARQRRWPADALTKSYDFADKGMCKIVGYRRKASAYPWIVKRNDDGKEYCYDDRLFARLTGLAV